jgi:hypothetical protein
VSKCHVVHRPERTSIHRRSKKARVYAYGNCARARLDSESEKRSKLAQTQQRRADWDGGSRDRRVRGPRASFKILRPSESMSLRLLGDRGTARDRRASPVEASHHQLTIFQK